MADANGDHCIVRVTGRFQSGVLTGHDVLQAEVLAHANFVDARLEVYLFPHDLHTWKQELGDLAPGAGALIGGGRGLSLVLHLQEDRSLVLAIEDPDRLSEMLRIRPPENWMDEHHDRLEQDRRTWPREVVETAPMTYEWRMPHPG